MQPFIEISIIMAIATAVALVMHILRQPLILGYIITGIVAGPFALDIIKSKDELELFSRIGIAALLFIVGLGLNPRVIREVGKVSLYAGLGQVALTTVVGFVAVYTFGFGLLASFYIALALTFSSTIVVLKILSDRKDVKKLYGKITTGILIVQDLIALVILAILASSKNAASAPFELLALFIKGAAAIAVLWLFSKYFLPYLSRIFSNSQEFLFLFAFAWALGVAAFFQLIGFTPEIGALAAGIALSVSPYQFEIGSKMKLLRDFFLIVFFILLGFHLSFNDVSRLASPIIALSLFVLVAEPLLLAVIMSALGYNRRVSFLTGLTMSQVSEFSFVLIVLGRDLGHLGADAVSVVTAVGLITIAISNYLLRYNDRVLAAFDPLLALFERRGAKSEPRSSEIYEAMLFGCHRVGADFLPYLKACHLKFLVVDFDPVVIEHLERKKIPCRYGDASDNGFLEEFDLKKVQLAVITVPDTDAVMNLISKIHKANKHAIVIATAHVLSEAMRCYKLGASYVILPHYLGGNYASLMIGKHGLDEERFRFERARHIKHLRKRERALA